MGGRNFVAFVLEPESKVLIYYYRKGGTAKASTAAARIYHGRSHLSRYCRSSVLLITGLWETGTSKDKGTWLRSGAWESERENPRGDEDGPSSPTFLMKKLRYPTL